MWFKQGFFFSWSKLLTYVVFTSAYIRSAIKSAAELVFNSFALRINWWKIDLSANQFFGGLFWGRGLPSAFMDIKLSCSGNVKSDNKLAL